MDIQKIDTNVIARTNLMPYALIGVCISIIIIVLLLILKILNKRAPVRARAVSRELQHLDKVKKQELKVVLANRFIQSATKIVNKTSFKINSLKADYWQYNITRIDLRIPGGSRIIKAEELNAVIVVMQCCLIALCIPVTVLISSSIGVLGVIVTLVLANTIPMMVIRNAVSLRDSEVIENFSEMYLMIHYVLISNNKSTSLSSILKSYDKTTNSEEMHRFVDVCIHNIDTYGEYTAADKIAKHYREVNEITKLMRLIKQSNEGGEVKAELMGFRSALMEAKEYAMDRRTDRAIAKAQASFNILIIILFQAILSAMSSYIDQISLINNFM